MNAAMEEIHVAQELVDERTRRSVIDDIGGTDLLNRPPVQHHDAIGDLHGFLLVVSNEDTGHVQLVVQAP
jgi:hypothetical protein